MTTGNSKQNTTINDNDVFWSDTASDSELPIMYVNAHNMQDDAHYKQGYIDGVSKFDNNVIQQNCDSTYRIGNILGYRVGKLIGKIQFNFSDNEPIKKTLLDKLNINNILQEKNFDLDQNKFINENMLDTLEKEIDRIIQEKKN
ncbi:hypothetical protein ACO0SA_001805 [Hanseniaspora valbyensis]